MLERLTDERDVRDRAMDIFAFDAIRRSTRDLRDTIFGLRERQDNSGDRTEFSSFVIRRLEATADALEKGLDLRLIQTTARREREHQRRKAALRHRHKLEQMREWRRLQKVKAAEQAAEVHDVKP